MIFSAIGSTVGAGLSALGSAAGTAGTAASAAGAAASAAPGVTGAGLLGTATSAIGQGIAYMGQQKAEQLRKRQMDLEISRQKRATIREAVAARATALVTGEAQGASGSSALAGGLNQISASKTSNLQGLSQSREIGNQMFGANSMVAAGQTIASIGGTFNDISSQLAKNEDMNYRVWGR